MSPHKFPAKHPVLTLSQTRTFYLADHCQVLRVRWSLLRSLAGLANSFWTMSQELVKLSAPIAPVSDLRTCSAIGSVRRRPECATSTRCLLLATPSAALGLHATEARHGLRLKTAYHFFAEDLAARPLRLLSSTWSLKSKSVNFSDFALKADNYLRLLRDVVRTSAWESLLSLLDYCSAKLVWSLWVPRGSSASQLAAQLRVSCVTPRHKQLAGTTLTLASLIASGLYLNTAAEAPWDLLIGLALGCLLAYGLVLRREADLRERPGNRRGIP